VNTLPPFDLEALCVRLVQLLRTPSPTGDTDAVLALISGWLGEMGYAPSRTRKGAVVITVPGRGDDAPRAVTAHVDTLGAIVKEIKPSGRLVFDRIGGYPYYAVNGEYCWVKADDGRTYTGTAVLVKSSSHVYREQVDSKEWKAEEMEIRLDAPLTGAAETRALGIEVGDLIAWDPRATVTETGYIKSRHLDDKAGVAVLLAALGALADSGRTPAQRTTFHFSYFGTIATASFPRSHR
jgi:putative aminopeptidase FrvX